MTTFGFRLIDHGRHWRAKSPWAEITGGFGLSLSLMNWEEDEDWSLHIRLGWPNIFIKLPLPRRKPKDDMMDQWGIAASPASWSEVMVHWGEHTKIIHAPWSPTHYRSSILAPDGRSWITEISGHRIPRNAVALGEAQCDWWRLADVPHWKKELPYRYVLQSGEIQNCTATISVEEREWRWRWFPWLPIGKVARSIDVAFSAEVGERAGSWKGGCIGCGYDLRHDETPEECLARMERERKF
jgi:hypothetical protein